LTPRPYDLNTWLNSIMGEDVTPALPSTDRGAGQISGVGYSCAACAHPLLASCTEMGLAMRCRGCRIVVPKHALHDVATAVSTQIFRYGCNWHSYCNCHQHRDYPVCRMGGRR